MIRDNRTAALVLAVVSLTVAAEASPAVTSVGSSSVQEAQTDKPVVRKALTKGPSRAQTSTSMSVGDAYPLKPGAQLGRLEEWDADDETGYRYDHWAFESRWDQTLVLELFSSEFDTYLIVDNGDGWGLEDDDGGIEYNSRLAFEAPYGQEVRVTVTSAFPGQGGTYFLVLSQGNFGVQVQPGSSTDEYGPSDAEEEVVAISPDSGTIAGTLEAGDPINDDAWYDAYEFQASAGEVFSIEMAGRDIGMDPLLVVTGPGGDVLAVNDDTEASLDARILFEAPADAAYRILATHWSIPDAPGPDALSAGRYELRLTAASTGGDDPTEPSSPDPLPIGPGDEIHGRLEAGDPTLYDGTWYDAYVFDGAEGVEVTIEMIADEGDALDPFLILESPRGEALADNDDHHGLDSRIDFVLPEDGPYRILANHVNPETEGDYVLRLEARMPEPLHFETGGSPDASYAVVVGLADYPGEDSDLPLVAVDADRMKRVLVEDLGYDPDRVLMIRNRAATRANIAAAIERFLGQAGPHGSALFYYSGHGTQVPQDDRLDEEPDSLDEALVLYDGFLRDDDLGSLLDDLATEDVVVVFDSCYSGTATRAADLPKGAPFERFARHLDADKALGALTTAPTSSISSATTVPLRGAQTHLFLASSAEHEVSWVAEDLGASVFTYYLTEALSKADATTTFAKIIEEVHVRTMRWARANNDRQSPHLEGADPDRNVLSVLGARR